MSKGRAKPTNPPSPPGDQEEPDLVTSDDLFGHLVDAPPPAREGRGRRREPIRVKLRDPETPAPLPAPAEEGGEEGVRPPHSPVRERTAFRPAAPIEDDEEARLPPGAVNTSARLTITPPKIAAGPGVDLASVAESGIVEPTPEDERPAPGGDRGRARARSYRTPDGFPPAA